MSVQGNKKTPQILRSFFVHFLCNKFCLYEFSIALSKKYKFKFSNISMRKIISTLLLLLCFISFKSIAQETQLYPTNWWIGMKKNNTIMEYDKPLCLMFYTASFN